MSLQTKEQSIGYILKAMIDSGTNTEQLKTHFKKLNEVVDSHLKTNKKIDNYTTHDFMLIVNRELGYDDETIKTISRYLFNAFDIFTVEEAETFYHSFKVILGVR